MQGARRWRETLWPVYPGMVSKTGKEPREWI